MLPVEWSSAVLNCIRDANTPYDAVFEGQAVYLDKPSKLNELILGTKIKVKSGSGLRRFPVLRPIM